MCIELPKPIVSSNCEILQNDFLIQLCLELLKVDNFKFVSELIFLSSFVNFILH